MAKTIKADKRDEKRKKNLKYRYDDSVPKVNKKPWRERRQENTDGLE